MPLVWDLDVSPLPPFHLLEMQDGHAEERDNPPAPHHVLRITSSPPHHTTAPICPPHTKLLFLKPAASLLLDPRTISRAWG